MDACALTMVDLRDATEDGLSESVVQVEVVTVVDVEAEDVYARPVRASQAGSSVQTYVHASNVQYQTRKRTLNTILTSKSLAALPGFTTSQYLSSTKKVNLRAHQIKKQLTSKAIQRLTAH